MNNNMNELIIKVLDWGHNRNLITGNTVDRQFTKTFEEVMELKAAIEDDDEMEMIDAIGDTLVTLILLAAIKDWNIQDCLQSAYDTIKNRTGKTVDGVFHKDPDHKHAIERHVFQHPNGEIDNDLDEPLGEPQPCTEGTCESCQ